MKAHVIPALLVLCSCVAPIAAQEIEPVKAQAVVAHEFAGRPIPKWENGYFLARDIDQPVVHVFDRSGALANRFTVKIPEATEVELGDVSVSREGVIAAAGGALSNGAGAGFIALLDRSGRLLRVVRTSPFIATKVCFAPDGAIWAIGRELETLGANANLDSHDVLRQYGSDGSLKRALLPKGSFRAYDRRHPAMGSLLAVSEDRIGVYSVPARQWIEVSPAGNILGRWDAVDDGSKIRTWTLALTASGSVYAGASVKDSGMQVYKLDRDAGRWMPIEFTKWFGPEARGVSVLGTDGADLVVSPRMPKLAWVPAL